MDKVCSHCRLDTAGNHEPNCPVGQNNKIFREQHCVKLPITDPELESLRAENEILKNNLERLKKSKSEEFEHIVYARVSNIINDEEFVVKTRWIVESLRAENERLKELLKVYRDCEICKHGQNPRLEMEPDKEFEKHCKWCESGGDNNWELADQALKG